MKDSNSAVGMGNVFVVSVNVLKAGKGITVSVAKRRPAQILTLRILYAQVTVMYVCYI